MRKTQLCMLAAALLTPALALAQGQTPPVPAGVQQEKHDIRRERKDIRGDRERIKQSKAQEKEANRDLRAKEKAAVDAVKGDKSLNPAQKKARIADVRKDFGAQRKALAEKFRDERKELREDIRKDRAEIRHDRQELREERRAAHPGH